MDNRIIKLDKVYIDAFDPGRVYSKGDECVINRYKYVSTSDNNKGNFPILGKHWDQVS